MKESTITLGQVCRFLINDAENTDGPAVPESGILSTAYGAHVENLLWGKY